MYRTYRLSVSVLSFALALAAGVLPPAVSASTILERCNELHPYEGARPDEHVRCVGLGRIEAHLTLINEKITPKLNALTRVPDASSYLNGEKTRIVTNLNDIKRRIEGSGWGSAGGGLTGTELRRAVAEIDTHHRLGLYTGQVNGATMADRMHTTLDAFATYADTYAQRLNEIEAQGLDVSAARALIAPLRADITSIRARGNTELAKLIALRPDRGDKTLQTQNNETRIATNAAIKAILIDARLIKRNHINRMVNRLAELESQLPASCTFNGTTIPHGQSVTAYQNSSVPAGQSCVSQQRTCTNGTLSGTYAFSTCTVEGPQGESCLFNGTVIPHGTVIDAYRNKTVTVGQTCESQRRRCTGGTLSGFFPYSECTVRTQCVAPFSSENVITHLTFDTATVDTDADGRITGGHDGDLREGSRRYNLDFRGRPTEQRLYISNTPSFNGSKSITYEMNRTPTPGVGAFPTTDKAFHALFGVHGPDSLYIRFGQKRYNTFAFYVPEDFEAPNKGNEGNVNEGPLIFQLWQGSPFSPPLSLHFRPVENPSDPLKFELRVLWNVGEVRKAEYLPVATIERGRWYRFAVVSEFSHSGMGAPGKAEVWEFTDPMTDVATLRTTYTGPLGFDPSVRMEGYRAQPDLDVVFGLYRHRQDRKQGISFDEFQFGEPRAMSCTP